MSWGVCDRQVTSYPAATPDTSGASPQAPPLRSVRRALTWVGQKAKGARLRLAGPHVGIDEAAGRLLTDLLAMDEWFIKSALPAPLIHDSSLALPAEPSPISQDRTGPNDRSLRVQQQVQLTLARRSRRTGEPRLHILGFLIRTRLRCNKEEAQALIFIRPLLFELPWW